MMTMTKKERFVCNALTKCNNHTLYFKHFMGQFSLLTQNKVFVWIHQYIHCIQKTSFADELAARIKGEPASKQEGDPTCKSTHQCWLLFSCLSSVCVCYDEILCYSLDHSTSHQCMHMNVFFLPCHGSEALSSASKKKSKGKTETKPARVPGRTRSIFLYN